MNKTEMINAIAEKAGITKKQAKGAVNAFTDIVSSELCKGEKVQILGFGNFEVTSRAARTGRNPQTGEEMEISASKSVKFKSGKSLKDRIK